MDNPRRPKFLRFWFPVILYSGIIFYASSVPNVKTPLAKIQFDKILHVLEYMPFGFLLARGIGSIKFSVSGRTLWTLVFLVSVLYGAGDEYHQSLVPGRSAGAADLIADVVGGAIGGYVYLVFTHNVGNK